MGVAMQGERHGKNAFTVSGEERPARRRSFLSDTMQFMPQASTGTNAEAALALLLGRRCRSLPYQEACQGQDAKRYSTVMRLICHQGRPCCQVLHVPQVAFGRCGARLNTQDGLEQVLAVAGALAVLGLWTLSRRSKAKQAPAPSPDVPHEALNMGNGLGHRARARHSND